MTRERVPASIGSTVTVALVLHDLFAVPFGEIAETLGRSPEAAKMLASRARRRVQAATPPDPDVARQREVVDAFLAAARGGDLRALLAVLDPDVTVRADAAAVPAGASRRVRGAGAVARPGRLTPSGEPVTGPYRRRTGSAGTSARCGTGQPVTVPRFAVLHSGVIYAWPETLAIRWRLLG